MFDLIHVMFLFVGHSNLSIATRACPWGVARPGAAVGSRGVDGRRDPATCSRGAGGPQGVGGS
jgi:hypothetical protein